MEAFTVSYLNRTSNNLLPVGFQSQGKANVIPFFSPLWVTALLVASRIRGVAIQIQVGVHGDRALKFALLSL